MTSPVLRVSPVSLRELAQRCTSLAGQVTPALPSSAVSAWQATGAAAGSVNAGARTAATAMRGRMTTSSVKLTIAAHSYEAMDHAGAAALAAVPQHGTGLPSGFPHSGVDGGAGGFGTPR